MARSRWSTIAGGKSQTPAASEILDFRSEILLSHEVEEGDIWRACQTKDAAIQDW